MRQITLRGIPDEIESIAREEAKCRGVSLNKAFLSLLRKGTEQKGPVRRKRSKGTSEFSAFLGLWNDEDAAIFDHSLREQREIDAELWS